MRATLLRRRGAASTSTRPDPIRRLAGLASLFTLFTLTFAGDDEYVRWSLAPPGPTPWHVLRYEITQRAPATTAVHRRRLPGTEEGDHALGLLTTAESRALLDAIRREDPHTIPSDPRPPRDTGHLWFECDLLLDGRPHTFLVREPARHPDPRVRRIFQAVRAAVLQHAGPIAFRNAFFPLDQRGWLNIESVPAATVVIDGLDTGATTPLYAYELEAGERTVELTSLDASLRRTYQVRVAPQGTTTLRVDLR